MKKRNGTLFNLFLDKQLNDKLVELAKKYHTNKSGMVRQLIIQCAQKNGMYNDIAI